MSSFGPGYSIGLALEKQPQDMEAISSTVKEIIQQGAYEITQSAGRYEDVHATNSGIIGVRRAIIKAIYETVEAAGVQVPKSEGAGEVVGEAWTGLDLSDYANELEEIVKEIKGTSCKHVAASQLSELEAMVSSMRHPTHTGEVGEVEGDEVTELDDEGFECENCGQPVNQDDKTCSGCGEPLNWGFKR